MDLGLLARFSTDLEVLGALLDERVDVAQANATPWRVDLRRFVRDLKALARGLDLGISTNAQAELAPTSAIALDPSALRKLSDCFATERTKLLIKASQDLSARRKEWRDDPRLTSQSLLAPLGLRNKEVALTKALAWALTPSVEDALPAEALAAVVAALLDRSDIGSDDVANWSVAAEVVDARGSDGSGRYDILLKGKLAGDQHVLIAIEAKIDALEGVGQIAAYQRKLAMRCKELKARLGPDSSVCSRLCYLTKAGGRPTGDDPLTGVQIVSWTYAKLFQTLLPVLQAHRDTASAAFTGLLLADIARDLAGMHVGTEPQITTVGKVKKLFIRDSPQ